MKRWPRLADDSGAAAAEMALMVPLLVLLIFGAFEAGHFVWTQHKLVEAVRDGARFGSRFSINTFCDGALAKSPDATYDNAISEIALLTRTGQIADADAMPKLPGWTTAQVRVEPECGQFVDTGIYTDLGASGAVLKVSAVNVTYPSLFNGLGIIDSTFRLTATSNAPVIGI